MNKHVAFSRNDLGQYFHTASEMVYSYDCLARSQELELKDSKYGIVATLKVFLVSHRKCISLMNIFRS